MVVVLYIEHIPSSLSECQVPITTQTCPRGTSSIWSNTRQRVTPNRNRGWEHLPSADLDGVVLVLHLVLSSIGVRQLLAQTHTDSAPLLYTQQRTSNRAVALGDQTCFDSAMLGGWTAYATHAQHASGRPIEAALEEPSNLSLSLYIYIYIDSNIDMHMYVCIYIYIYRQGSPNRSRPGRTRRSSPRRCASSTRRPARTSLMRAL